MNKYILIAIITVVVVALAVAYALTRPTIDTCTLSGGIVSTASCCKSATDFPNNCVIGACGCSLNDSHEINVCNCPEGKCYDGSKCVAVETGRVTFPE
jgi:hypothetical protein